ncbi:hypothetical protein DFH28DRAFT_1137535 [Melampsora americana]|nr:hypothetical protein DFH28DRAFT_1137535 [Melampsora americana]
MEIPMPTNEDIIQSTSEAKPAESPVIDSDDSEVEVERVPFTLVQMRKAIEEITYGMECRPDHKLNEDEPNWRPHIQALEKMSEDLSHVQFSSLKQTSLDSFFKSSDLFSGPCLT